MHLKLLGLAGLALFIAGCRVLRPAPPARPLTPSAALAAAPAAAGHAVTLAWDAWQPGPASNSVEIIISASADLASWQVITNLAPDQARVTFSNRPAAEFYRIGYRFK